MTKGQIIFSDSIYQLNILGKIVVEMLKEQCKLSVTVKKSRVLAKLQEQHVEESFPLGLATADIYLGFSLPKIYKKIGKNLKVDNLSLIDAVLVKLVNNYSIRFK